MKQKRKSDVAVLLDYAGSHKRLTFLGLALSAVSMLLSMAPYICIWLAARDLIAVAPDWTEAQSVAQYGWLAFAFAVAGIILYFAGLMCTHLAAFRTASNIRKQGVAHVMKAPLGFFDSNASGLIRGRLDAAAADTETLLAHNLADIVGTITLFVAMLVMMLVFDWRMGAACLLAAVISIVAMFSMMGGKNAQILGEYQAALDRITKAGTEYVRGIPVVKTFGQSVFSFKKFKATIDEYEKWVVSYTKELRLPMMFYTAAVNGVFAFLIAGGLLFTTHGVTPEFLLNLLFYIIITPVISLTLTRIMYMSENKMVVADALARIDSVLEAAPMQVQAVPQHPKDSSVTLRDVHFSYDGKTEVIKGVSMDIQPGQTVAFVGPSGGGKSTLANLVCRFFDVQSGSVRVGGADVRDIPKEELMDTISFVFQNSRLLKGSILDNVRLGRPQATEAEVLAVLKAAQCMDIVEKFPAGIHTVIGTKGVYLSGGEQQRIAIARAMLKNAPILILDEATAFADPDNEAKVQAAFAQLAKGKTVLMIAHRLSTVANADCIYVVRDGRIAESGTKDELCAQNGLFARMWQEYQASVQWKVAKEG